MLIHHVTKFFFSPYHHHLKPTIYSMASWINDNRAAILNKHRVEYKGLAGIRQKALLKKIIRDLQGTDGEPLPNKTQKVKHTFYILHCPSLSHQ
jgi:hypothetical protein